MLDEATAARFMRLTLGHLTREWPNTNDQIASGPEDLLAPSALHPLFYGSLDWHSCVHGWWQVMRLARLFPAAAPARDVEALAARMLTPDRVAGELAYLARPLTGSFERPYGWGWLLALHAELALRPDRAWAATLEPLARAFATRFAEYLAKLPYAVRSGKHDNTAFALIHTIAWARAFDPALAALIEARAQAWFGDDADVRPLEPSGEDFLSATLCEAMLMQSVLGDGFKAWFGRFLPDPFALACLTSPATVTDRSDGRLAHLDGLNLARAWAWRTIADATADPARADAIADAHLAAALPHLADDYMGEHWLATFALLALEASAPAPTR